MLDFYNSTTWTHKSWADKMAKLLCIWEKASLPRKWTNGLQVQKLRKLIQDLEIISAKLSGNGILIRKLLTKPQQSQKLRNPVI